MTDSDIFGRPSPDAEETATERRLRSFRPRPPQFTAEAILAAAPREPASADQVAAVRRRLVVAVAAAWLGGMITGAAALHLLRGPAVDLRVADAASVDMPSAAESRVPETPAPTDASESPRASLEQRRDRAATNETNLPGPRSAYRIAATPADILHDYELRVGGPLRVRPRSDQRPAPSDTAAAVESSSPPASEPIEQRKPLTPTSYRQWPAAGFELLIRDVRG